MGGLQARECSVYGGQKRELDPLKLEFLMVMGGAHGCWEPDTGPLEEQQDLNPSATSRTYKQ